MKKCLNIIILLFIFSTPLFAQEFAYVTDSLQLRVYSSASAESEVLQTIDSGDSLEVLVTEDGFSQVTTYDGTVGWVKSAFLVEEPPAKLLYYSVSEKNKELEAEIESLKNSLQTNSTPITSERDTTQIKDLQAVIEQQQKTNQKLQQLLDNNAAEIGENAQSFSDTYAVASNNQAMQWLVSYKWWLVGVTSALLLFGFLLGMKLSSRRMTKRLHGFRF